MTDEALVECPVCKGKIARMLFPVGIMFKGSGFHVNDYPSSKPATTSSPKPEAKTDKEPVAAAKS
jgi:predicted nucleic acid-binding Zn ribbon protein